MALTGDDTLGCERLPKTELPDLRCGTLGHMALLVFREFSSLLIIKNDIYGYISSLKYLFKEIRITLRFFNLENN